MRFTHRGDAKRGISILSHVTLDNLYSTLQTCRITGGLCKPDQVLLIYYITFATAPLLYYVSSYHDMNSGQKTNIVRLRHSSQSFILNSDSLGVPCPMVLPFRFSLSVACGCLTMHQYACFHAKGIFIVTTNLVQQPLPVPCHCLRQSSLAESERSTPPSSGRIGIFTTLSVSPTAQMSVMDSA